jgi:phosphatidylglycerophosphate synthase
MFDAQIRSKIDPTLNAIGRQALARGLTADAVTWIGFGCGIAAAFFVATGSFILALAFIFLSRLMDGLDGAVARASQTTDRGGFLDITLDFFFYGAIPAAFAVADPQANALPAVLLIMSFYMNGSAFLAYAIIAEKRHLSTTAQGIKSLYYLTGIAEGAETIAVFTLMCLMPSWFGPLAYLFAAICIASAAARVAMGVYAFDPENG